MHMCIYAYAYMHICIYVYMYICILETRHEEPMLPQRCRMFDAGSIDRPSDRLIDIFFANRVVVLSQIEPDKCWGFRWQPDQG